MHIPIHTSAYPPTGPYPSDSVSFHPSTPRNPNYYRQNLFIWLHVRMPTFPHSQTLISIFMYLALYYVQQITQWTRESPQCQRAPRLMWKQVSRNYNTEQWMDCLGVLWNHRGSTHNTCWRAGKVYTFTPLPKHYPTWDLLTPRVSW